jgi:hypothetical protein
MYIEIKETINKKDVIPQQKQAGPVKQIESKKKKKRA